MKKISIILSIMICCIVFIPLKSQALTKYQLGDSNIKVEINKSTWEYTGEEIKPTVAVIYQPNTYNIRLVEGTDYRVYYERNVNHGTGLVYVQALSGSDYLLGGTISIKFTIVNVHTGGDITDLDPQAWDPSTDTNPPGDAFKEKVGVILAAINAIGVVVSVVVLMVIGIRSLTCSLEEKAVYKQSLPGYIIGVIMVISISTIPNIIFQFAKNI